MNNETESKSFRVLDGVKVGRKICFLDEMARGPRAISNPFDSIKFNDFKIEYYNHRAISERYCIGCNTLFKSVQGAWIIDGLCKECRSELK